MFCKTEVFYYIEKTKSSCIYHFIINRIIQERVCENKMKDKERILMVVITRIIPGLVYLCNNYKQKEEYVKSYMLNPTELEKGDLVYANSSIYPNDFCVGFVDTVHSDRVVIREIGSQRLCNYYNETFTKISKEKLGYEILEGTQYKTYQKVMKAFESTKYYTRFKSISFADRECVVQAREAYKDETIFEISFNYNSKTSIKTIAALLVEKENQQDENNKTKEITKNETI